MVEQTLRQSVLERLHLPKLGFETDNRRFDPTYREFLEIEVTEVYGSSALPRVGDNYLICGRYTLKEHEPVKLFACAANSSSTGIEAFLLPGSGQFTTNLFVKEVVEPRRPLLILMIDTDTNAIDIHLGQQNGPTRDVV